MSIEGQISYLVVMALSPLNNKILGKLLQVFSTCNCNIHDAKIANLGQELAAMFLLSGTWNAIAKVEVYLAKMEKKYDLRITFQRTEKQPIKEDIIPYVANIYTLDKVGVLQELVKFFFKHGIVIKDIYTTTFTKLSHSHRVALITISIDLSIYDHIPTIREEFISYCDNLNVDATIEPKA